MDSFSIKRKIRNRWERFWMRFAGTSHTGRQAVRLAALFTPPHYERIKLAYMNPRGYVSHLATISHSEFISGKNIFVDDRCLIYQAKRGGKIETGDDVAIYRDSIIETGEYGNVTIGAESSIHPRCQIIAYANPIMIGRGVMIAANCAIYSYDHKVFPSTPIRRQPLTTKGEVVIGDESWIGTGVIILSGVRIGHGAVVGAGSVVTRDVPDGAIAVGNPARVVKWRRDLVVSDSLEQQTDNSLSDR
jgi:acetyltransferase-like isoleucine patch superfamily enzyme